MSLKKLGVYYREHMLISQNFQKLAILPNISCYLKNFVKLQYGINFLTVFEAAAIEVTDEAALEMETLLAFIEAITAWTDPED